MTNAKRNPVEPIVYTPAEQATVRRLRVRRNAAYYLDHAAYDAATEQEAAVHRSCYRRHMAQHGLSEPEPRAARAPRPAAAPAQPRPNAHAVKPAKGDGVTARIYQWCLDHPAATKKDAAAAFPAANPTTVGVQFGKARRGS